ncbi:hypothetical protein [Leekyejoonella antrihumi]|uniref:Uncharacterized protein n=1 Tax=Leekyejoonella antrihumi TaxID=1660198 RepID=A0A563DWZ8_9MICO|nr:hypothetical protein [Leekyejoonella antrihumi]TWP34491.1 hypothetical protein FGL98_17415 [Leekyejoonella antrihumi]
MTPPDRRSVGELLLDADYLARLTLLDADGEAAPAMLRTWPEVVQSAAELWAALPHPPDPDVMHRLEAITHGMHRDQIRRGWPGDGPPDERLLQISENFTRAASLVANRWPVPRRSRSGPSAREAADLEAARTRTVHTLWVGGHSVSVATGEHAHDLRLLKHSHATCAETRGIGRGKDAQDRLGAFETLAAGWLKDRWPGALNGEYRDPPDATRLGQALCQWDVQVHRTLTTLPSTANLWLATATQATIVDTTAILLHAGAQRRAVDGQTVARIGSALRTTQQDWSHACGLWQQLHSPLSSRFDNTLTQAAAEVRAATKEITHDPTGLATPELITSRLGPEQIAPIVGQALASSLELAHVIHEITASGDPILAATNNIARIASTRLRQQPPQPEGVDAFPVNLTGIRANRVAPIPDLIRDQLDAAGQHLIASSSIAMNSGTDLNRHRQATAPSQPTPRPPAEPPIHPCGEHLAAPPLDPGSHPTAGISR